MNVDQIIDWWGKKSHFFSLLCLIFFVCQVLCWFAFGALRIVFVVYVQEKLGFLVFRYTWMGLLLDYLAAFCYDLLLFPGGRLTVLCCGL